MGNGRKVRRNKKQVGDMTMRLLDRIASVSATVSFLVAVFSLLIKKGILTNEEVEAERQRIHKAAEEYSKTGRIQPQEAKPDENSGGTGECGVLRNSGDNNDIGSAGAEKQEC